MAQDVVIQLGMFGISNQVAGTHVVQAHTRVLANGEEVFVGEHLRWSRGRSAPARRSTPSDVDLEAQQDLFGGPPDR